MFCTNLYLYQVCSKSNLMSRFNLGQFHDFYPLNKIWTKQGISCLDYYEDQYQAETIVKDQPYHHHPKVTTLHLEPVHGMLIGITIQVTIDHKRTKSKTSKMLFTYFNTCMKCPCHNFWKLRDVLLHIEQVLGSLQMFSLQNRLALLHRH